MKFLKYLIATAVAALSQLSGAADCNQAAPARPSFALKDVAPQLDSEADSINAWWTQGRGALPLSEALIERQDRINAVYTRLSNARRSLYASLSCTVRSVKQCCSTSGRRHECPVSESPPGRGTRFNVEKMTIIEDDFDVAPHQPAGRNYISYVVKRTGSGCNTAGFSAPVLYADGTVQAFVEQDMEMVRTYFQEKVRLSPPNNNINSGSNTADSAPRTDRVSQLERLKRLLDSGALTQAEFDREKARILAGQ